MTAYAPAAARDVPALAALWQTCFGDPASDSEPILTHPQIRTFAAYVDGKPVSMLCALPATLVDEAGGEAPCAYLYAVCTDPAFRRRGLSSGLLAFAEEALRCAGFSCAVLVPANESLFGFYQKNGYQTVFYQKKYEAAPGGAADIRPVGAADYRALRELQLYGCFVSFPEAMLGLLPQRWRIETDTAVCCAAGAVQDGVLCLQELLPDVPEAAAALAARLGCTRAEVCTTGGDRPFAMAKALGAAALPERAYLGVSFA